MSLNRVVRPAGASGAKSLRRFCVWRLINQDVFLSKTSGSELSGKAPKHAEGMNFNVFFFFRQLFLEKVCARHEWLTGGRAGDADHPHVVLHEPSNKGVLCYLKKKTRCNTTTESTREHLLCHYLDYKRGIKGIMIVSFLFSANCYVCYSSSAIIGLFQLFFRVLEDWFRYQNSKRAPEHHFRKRPVTPGMHQALTCGLHPGKAPGARGTPALTLARTVVVIPGCRSQTGPGGSRRGWWRTPPYPGSTRRTPWGESRCPPRIWSSRINTGGKGQLTKFDL